jgi:uracil-DNA glycosylase
MTSNLIKMNHVKKKRPPKDVEDLICSTFPVLKYEIQMLQPDVVIFFTGPFYDARIQKTFNDAVFEPIEHFNQRHFARVSQPDLPFHTYRTYHPGFSMRERARYFNPVADALKMLVK